MKSLRNSITARKGNIARSFLIVFVFALALPNPLVCQESIGSSAASYYDFLSLTGVLDRPTLNYRTLSDSQWDTSALEAASHPWQGQNLGTSRTVLGEASLRLYGPEFFSSYNSASPFGAYDGLLWQGRGLNASLSAGGRLSWKGLELTFKPVVAASQNVGFDYLPSAYDSPYGYFWGYGGNAGADSPQRFGSSPLVELGWGDSELRYTWKAVTVGFGTQAVWLGPAAINPLLHSNNAPPYPKVDVGLRKTGVTIPKLNWYAGDVELRLWTGYLSESAYFDSNPSNDHNMIHGLSLAYAPSFLPGLTLSANRVCLAKWRLENLRYIVPMGGNTIEGSSGEGEDQKASVAFSLLLPSSGLELYGELGKDDFSANSIRIAYIRYPFHTLTYTVGLKKSFDSIFTKKVKGLFRFEWNTTEMSQDFQMQWPYSFGFHHQITQGYTNHGQWLGSGIGYGGNCQYMDVTLYHDEGSVTFLMARHNPDNNFVYSKSINASADEDNLVERYFVSWKAHYLAGVAGEFFVSRNASVRAGITYDLIVNPNYENGGTTLHNVYCSLSASYQF